MILCITIIYLPFQKLSAIYFTLQIGWSDAKSTANLSLKIRMFRTKGSKRRTVFLFGMHGDHVYLNFAQ